MKICFISQEFPPDTGWGGIGTYVYNISRGLAELGHQVDVITRAIKQDGLEEFCDGRLRIHRVWHKDYPMLRKMPWNLLKPYLHLHHVLDRPLGWGCGAFKHLQKLLTQTSFQIVEVAEHNADGFLYAVNKTILKKQGTLPKFVVKLQIPMIFYYQLNQFNMTRDIKLLNTLERWTTRHADAITSPSRKMAEIVSGMWNLDVETIHILPYPIDDDLFIPDPSAQRDEAIIVFVGRLEQQKGVGILVDAFKEVLHHCPNTKLLLVGGDHISSVNGLQVSFKAQLEQKLRSYNIESSVQFIGKVERSLLPQYYQSSRVCVVPSDFESFSNVCAEAMACGRPVIATNSGAIPEYMVDRKNGILIPPQNHKMLAEALVYLLNNQAIAEQLGQEARRAIETQYSRHMIAQKTAMFYEQLIDE